MTISGDFDRSTRPAPRWWVFSSSNALSSSHRSPYSAASSVAGAWAGSTMVVMSRIGGSPCWRDGWDRVYSTTRTVIGAPASVSYTHLRAHETGRNLVCRLLLEKKKKKKKKQKKQKKKKTKKHKTKKKKQTK